MNFKIFVDDENYVCFWDEDILWMLTSQGWEAYLYGEHDLELCTHAYTFPTDVDINAAREEVEIWEEAEAQIDIDFRKNGGW